MDKIIIAVMCVYLFYRFMEVKKQEIINAVERNNKNG